MDTYSIQETVLASEERSLYHALTLVVAQRALLLTKVKLSALISPIAGPSQHLAYTHLDRYTVDFVLCDRSTTRPLLALLQDKTQAGKCSLSNTNDLIERLAASAGLPLLRLDLATAYRMDTLLRLIEPYMVGDSRGSDYANGDRLAPLTKRATATMPHPAMHFSAN